MKSLTESSSPFDNEALSLFLSQDASAVEPLYRITPDSLLFLHNPASGLLGSGGDNSPTLIMKDLVSEVLSSKKSHFCLFSGEEGSGKSRCMGLCLQGLSQHGQTGSASISLANDLIDIFVEKKTTNCLATSRAIKIFKFDCASSTFAVAALLTDVSASTSLENADESSFFIFNALADTASDELRQRYHLRPSLRAYPHFANVAPPPPGRPRLDGIISMLQSAGMSSDDVDALLRTLSAVLLLPAIETSGEGKARDINALAAVMGVSEVSLEVALERRSDCHLIAQTMYVKAVEFLCSKLSSPRCSLSREASSLFLVQSLGSSPTADGSVNAFLSNCANDFFEDLFHARVIKNKSAELAAEGIPTPMGQLHPNDLSDVVKLLEKSSPSIFSILDREAKRGIDGASLCSKLKETFRLNKRIFVAPESLKFRIRHILCSAEYDARRFVADNVFGTLPIAVATLLSGSDATSLASLFSPPGRTDVRADASLTQTGAFNRKLMSLRRAAEASRVVFVRCVAARAKGRVDAFFISTQLAALAIADAIKACGGFNEMVPLGDAFAQLTHLTHSHAEPRAASRQALFDSLDAVGFEANREFSIGNSFVYFKSRRTFERAQQADREAANEAAMALLTYFLSAPPRRRFVAHVRAEIEARQLVAAARAGRVIFRAVSNARTTTQHRRSIAARVLSRFFFCAAARSARADLRRAAVTCLAGIARSNFFRKKSLFCELESIFDRVIRRRRLAFNRFNAVLLQRILRGALGRYFAAFRLSAQIDFGFAQKRGFAQRKLRLKSFAARTLEAARVRGLVSESYSASLRAALVLNSVAKCCICSRLYWLVNDAAHQLAYRAEELKARVHVLFMRRMAAVILEAVAASCVASHRRFNKQICARKLSQVSLRAVLRGHHAAQFDAARHLQRTSRTYRANNRVADLRLAALFSQAFVRQLFARATHAACAVASSQLLRATRSLLARTRHSAARVASATLQALLRRALMRSAFCLLILSAERLNLTTRRRKHEEGYAAAAWRARAARLQGAARRYLAQEKMGAWIAAVINVTLILARGGRVGLHQRAQSAARRLVAHSTGSLFKRHARDLRAATLILGAHFLRSLKRRLFGSNLKAVKVILRTVAGMALRVRFSSRRSACRNLQLATRRSIAQFSEALFILACLDVIAATSRRFASSLLRARRVAAKSLACCLRRGVKTRRLTSLRASQRILSSAVQRASATKFSSGLLLVRSMSRVAARAQLIKSVFGAVLLEAITRRHHPRVDQVTYHHAAMVLSAGLRAAVHRRHALVAIDATLSGARAALAAAFGCALRRRFLFAALMAATSISAVTVRTLRSGDWFVFSGAGAALASVALRASVTRSYFTFVTSARRVADAGASAVAHLNHCRILAAASLLSEFVVARSVGLQVAAATRRSAAVAQRALCSRQFQITCAATVSLEAFVRGVAQVRKWRKQRAAGRTLSAAVIAKRTSSRSANYGEKSCSLVAFVARLKQRKYHALNKSSAIVISAHARQCCQRFKVAFKILAGSELWSFAVRAARQNHLHALTGASALLGAAARRALWRRSYCELVHLADFLTSALSARICRAIVRDARDASILLLAAARRTLPNGSFASFHASSRKFEDVAVALDARKHLAQGVSAVVKIEFFIARWLRRGEWTDVVSAAGQVFSVARRAISNHRYGAIVASAAILSRRLRCTFNADMVRLVITEREVLSAAIKMVRARSLHGADCSSANVAQAKVRGVITRALYGAERCSASFLSAYITRLYVFDFSIVANSAADVQAATLRSLVRKAHSDGLVAVSQIQRACRQRNGREAHGAARLAANNVAFGVRRCLHARSYGFMRLSVISPQSAVVQLIARRHFASLRVQAVELEAHLRSVASRRAFGRIRIAAQALQGHGRCAPSHFALGFIRLAVGELEAFLVATAMRLALTEGRATLRVLQGAVRGAVARRRFVAKAIGLRDLMGFIFRDAFERYHNKLSLAVLFSKPRLVSRRHRRRFVAVVLAKRELTTHVRLTLSSRRYATRLVASRQLARIGTPFVLRALHANKISSCSLLVSLIRMESHNKFHVASVCAATTIQRLFVASFVRQLYADEVFAARAVGAFCVALAARLAHRALHRSVKTTAIYFRRALALARHRRAREGMIDLQRFARGSFSKGPNAACAVITALLERHLLTMELKSAREAARVLEAAIRRLDFRWVQIDLSEAAICLCATIARALARRRFASLIVAAVLVDACITRTDVTNIYQEARAAAVEAERSLRAAPLRLRWRCLKQNSPILSVYLKHRLRTAINLNLWTAEIQRDTFKSLRTSARALQAFVRRFRPWVSQSRRRVAARRVQGAVSSLFARLRFALRMATFSSEDFVVKDSSKSQITARRCTIELQPSLRFLRLSDEEVPFDLRAPWEFDSGTESKRFAVMIDVTRGLTSVKLVLSTGLRREAARLMTGLCYFKLFTETCRGRELTPPPENSSTVRIS